MLSPLLFLDFDDVLCVSQTYGGGMLLMSERPADLYSQLFRARAVETLLTVLAEFTPRVIVTSSWLRFLDKPACLQLFERTGLIAAANLLHEHWDAPQNAGEARLLAVERWLARHHRGEPYVLVDDAESGNSLRDSRHDRAGRVVLCEVGVGLSSEHVPALRRALQTA